MPMKAYHRIVGDPPAFGFAGSISSIGFPGGNWALAVSARRLPPSQAVPFPEEQKETLQLNKVVTRTQNAYELQSLTFQCIAAIFSNEGKEASGRPHGYSDIVALVPQDGETVSAEEMLTFDGFMSLQEFWGLSTNAVTYEVKDWSPKTSIPNRCTISLPADMHAALAMRYWRSATARLFDNNARPSTVRVCLGNERVGENIIEQAKAFFSAYILPVLPCAARHLVSMSAPVAAKFTQKFDPTALAFLYPEDALSIPGDKMLFDLRCGSFVPLSEEKSAFMKLVMSGRKSGYVQKLYERSVKLGNKAKEDDTPFMADFDIIFALYRLEYGKLSSEERVALWRNVQELLVRRHGYTDAQADQLLEAFEDEWLSVMEKQPVAMQDADFAFLMMKALRTGSRRITDVLVMHQQSRLAPFFGTVLKDEHLQGSSNIQNVIGAMLHEAWLKQPIDQPQLDALYADEYYQLAQNHKPLFEAMVAYLNAFNGLYPDKALFIMPLGKQYLDQARVLNLSIQQLRNEYTQNLPGEVACRSIREASDVMNVENLNLLNTFYVEAFVNHQHNALPFVAMCQSMGQDPCAALCGILNLDQTNPGAAAFPLDNQQLNLTLGGLLPMVKAPDHVHAALYGYVQRVLKRAENDDVCVLRWLCALDPENGLLRPDERAALGVEHYAAVYGKLGSEPSQGDFEMVKQWLGRADQTQRGYFEKLLKPLYDNLAPAGLLQASQLWPYFATLLDAPKLRDAHFQQMVTALTGDWSRTGYFQAIDAQREQWKLSNITAKELMDNGTVRAQATGKLERQFATISTGNDFVQTFDRMRAQTQDAFTAYGYQMLNARFAKSYQQMLMNTQSVGDVENVEALCKKLGAESAVGNLAARRSAVALIQVNQFILSELPTLHDSQLPIRAQAMARTLDGMPEGPVASRLHSLIYNEVQKITHLPIRKRMAAALITSGRGTHVKGALDLLPWEHEANSPLTAKGAALFSQLCMLMDIANAIHPNYVPALLQAIPKYHPDYPKRIKSMQKQMRTVMPWCTDPNSGAPQAFVQWIHQCMNMR